MTVTSYDTAQHVMQVRMTSRCSHSQVQYNFLRGYLAFRGVFALKFRPNRGRDTRGGAGRVEVVLNAHRDTFGDERDPVRKLLRTFAGAPDDVTPPAPNGEPSGSDQRRSEVHRGVYKTGTEESGSDNARDGEELCYSTSVGVPSA